MSNFFSKYYARLSARNDSIAVGDATTGTTMVVNSDGSINVVGTGSGGSILVTQGTIPWIDNVAQFGGNNVVTGVGVSGLGIPRVTVSNDSNILATQSGTWNIATLTSITNPVTVTQGTSPWVISGATTVTGTVTANQGTSPWVVSGTVLVSNFPTTVDTAYGTVGANTLRSAAQIGNAAGAALFGAGTTTTQVLRVVLPTDQTAIPATQSGTWTVQQGTPPWSVSQSGTWNIGTVTTLTSITNPVTVAQATAANLNATVVGTGTFAVQATQAGTWNINNISGTISLPTGASTSANQTNGTQKTQIVDGAGTVIGAAQTISGTNYFPVVQASSATPGSAAVARSTQVAGSDGTNARTLLTDTSGNLQIVGNVASGSADSGNPVKISGVFNTTAPTVTSGNRNNLQLDNKASVYVNHEGRRRTYSAAVNGLTVAATASDILTITGAASTIVRIKKIEFSCSSTNNLVTPMLLIKRSTANTGGTSAAVAAVSHNSGDAAASATVLSYTANPTLGTTVGTMRTTRFQTSGANTVVPSVIPWEFERTSQAPTLLSTSEVIALNLNATTIAGSLFNIYIEWTEE